MLSPKQVAIAGLVLLVAVGCGTPDAAPKPSPTVPTISTSLTSTRVSPAPVPSNNAITVKPPAEPATTEAEEPVVEPTTEAPAPPPEPPPPPPPVETTDPPTEGPFVLQGTACQAEGAVAVNRRLQPLVCTAEGDGLRWQPL